MRFVSKLIDYGAFREFLRKYKPRESEKESKIDVAKLEDDGSIYIFSIDDSEEFEDIAMCLKDEWEHYMDESGLVVLLEGDNHNGVKIVESNYNEIWDRDDG